MKQKINFWWQETLLLCPKQYLHSKGPKNATCLWLSHNKEHCTFNQQCSLSWLSQRQTGFLRPFEWRYHVGLKGKVSCHQKLVFRSAVRFLFLVVLTDAILLNLDLQKRIPGRIDFSAVYTFAYHWHIKYPKIGDLFFCFKVQNWFN